MKLKLGRKRRELTEEETESPSISAETLAGLLDIKRHTVPEGFTEVETYPLKAPFSYASIVQSEDTGTYLYIVDELLMTKEENDLFHRMRNILEYEFL